MIGNVSNLVKIIEESAVPAWLYDYIEEHLNEIIFDLKVIGTHEIPMPDGRTMMLSTRDKKLNFKSKSVTAEESETRKVIIAEDHHSAESKTRIAVIAVAVIFGWVAVAIGMWHFTR